MSGIEIGKKYRVTIKEISSSGVKVQIKPGKYGFIKKKDFVFSKLIEDLHEVTGINDTVSAVVVNIDYSNKFIYLDHNITRKSPWDDIDEKHWVGKVVGGIVTEVQKNGVFVEILTGIEGFVPNSEIFDDKGVSRKFKLWERDDVMVKIISLSSKDKNIELSIKEVIRDDKRKSDNHSGGSVVTLGDLIEEALDLQSAEVSKTQKSRRKPEKHSIRTILFVDDEEGILESFPRVLAEIDPDAEVMTADTVEKAIALYRGNEIDLLITDLYFPDSRGDGYELIEHIRTLDDEQLICVFTGNKNTDYPRLMKYNLAGILEKPMQKEEVEDALVNVKSGNFSYNLKRKFGATAYESFFNDQEEVSTYYTQLKRLLKNIQGFSSADFVGILKMDPVSKNISLEEKLGDLKKKGPFTWNNLKKSPVTDVMNGKELICRNYIKDRAPEKFKNFSRHIDVESFIGIPLYSISNEEYGLFLAKHKGGKFADADFENAKRKANQVEKLIDYMSFDNALKKEGKLISTGQLSAALIHEIKNHMQVLSDQVDWLKQMVNAIVAQKIDISIPKNQEELTKLSNKVQGKKNDFFEIIKSFRNLFDDNRIHYVSLNLLVDEVIRMTKPNLKKYQIVHYKRRTGKLPYIRIYGERLKHILINIILNAADQLKIFRTYGRAISIETIFDSEDPEFPFKIRISDNACGIHKALQDRIFDFLFTTKKEGMGLGLFICKSLITSMGGVIEIEKSFMYLGTSFLIKLPDTRRKSNE